MVYFLIVCPEGSLGRPVGGEKEEEFLHERNRGQIGFFTGLSRTRLSQYRAKNFVSRETRALIVRLW